MGGRTGLTALVAGLCFALALVCGPLLMAIPAEATAPAMLVVGLMLLGALRRIDWRRFDDLVPVVVALGAALLTGNLINSIACGTAAVLAIALLRGAPRAASPLLWAMGALFAAYYLLLIRIF
jgi:AGZA family xanthine/uracil permease-like MFS transporter